MTLLQVWQNAVLVSLGEVGAALVSFLPAFLGAIVIFIVGLLVAGWAKKLVERVLTLVRLESLSTSSGFAGWLARAEIKLSATGLFGELIRWLILLVFFLAAVEVLGLQVVSTVLTSVLGYIPNVLAAALIIGAGFVIGNLVDGLVRGAFATISHEAARPVGRLARWAIVVVAFFAAVDQLKIAPKLIDTFFQGLTWTIVLVVGLSVGLGSKDIVARLFEDWFKKLK